MKEYQKQMLGIRRIRKKLSILPFFFTNDTLVWTGKWFKTIEIEEEMYQERYLEFDDGWSYQFYWGKWKTRWEFIRIVN